MRRKICFVAVVEMSVKAFLLDYMRLMQDMFDFTVIVNTDDPHFLEPYGIEARVIPLALERRGSPSRDLKAFRSLYRIFRNERFDIVHSIMPKSGLLSMTAGFLARVPVRIHTFTGQFWKNSTGMKRLALKAIDRIIAVCATNILVDSPSQREFIISEGIVSRKKSSVIGSGSICGVDENRFRFNEDSRREIREMFGISGDEIVFLYVGRMNLDKGVLDLAKAFASLWNRFKNVRLFLVGPDEEGIRGKAMEICARCSDRVNVIGYTDEPEKYMSAADVFCLPSYREGFGLVIIEAAATGIPSIGSRIYGITDTIEDEATGLFLEPGAYHDLMLKMSRFVEEPALVREMGDRARAAAIEKYTKGKVVSAMADYYRGLERRR